MIAALHGIIASKPASSGPTWLDVDDEWTIGGDITRVGNSLNTPSSSSGPGVMATTSLKLYDGAPGGLRFTATSYLIGFKYESTAPSDENQVTYAAIAHGYTGGSGDLVAFSKDGVDDNYVEASGITVPEIVEMEFTATELIWYYGSGRTEWFRMSRVTLGYPLFLVADAGGGGFQNIQQWGLTL